MAAKTQSMTKEAAVSRAPRSKPKQAKVTSIDLDRLIHERTRLAIVSALAANSMLTFTDLKSLLQVSENNAGAAREALAEAAAASGASDTLQAVSGHAYADPWEAPGTRDLTAHVDFATLVRIAEGQGARWLVDGWRLFAHAPLAWLSVVFAYGLIMMLMSAVPVIGTSLSLRAV